MQGLDETPPGPTASIQRLPRVDVWIKVALLPSRGLKVTPTVSVLWLRWEAGSPNLGGVSQRYDKGRIPKYLIPPLGMLNSNSGEEADTWRECHR